MPNCQTDCRCTHFAAVLAVDTSHICSIGRLASTYGTAASKFESLLEIHHCDNSRAVVTSSALMEHEMDLADPSCPVRDYIPSAPLDSLGCVAADRADSSRATALRALTSEAPDGQTIDLRERDATLVAVAEARAEHEPVALVTDDERLLSWLVDMQGRSEVASIPLHVLILLLEMVACGALPVEDFLASASAEESHHSTLYAADWIVSAKTTRLKRLVNAAATIAEGEP